MAAHYIAFMKREGLSAAGLVAESHKWAPPENLPRDLTQWYFDRLRDTHDLFHVLTGYGRDALGEASLLALQLPAEITTAVFCSSPMRARGRSRR